MRVAVVHDWLVDRGGAERVTRELIDLFDADAFALVDFLNDTDRAHILNGTFARTTWIQHLPFARSHFRWYLPLFPSAINALDLRTYDLIISSSYAVAKGVRIHPGQKHVCYLHTPMRYAWVDTDTYLRDHGIVGWKAAPVRWWMARFRRWDLRTNSRIDRFVANGKHVAQRAAQYYLREADVVLPPVDDQLFSLTAAPRHGYVTASRLVPYKRVDRIVAAFRDLPGLTLTVVGSGPAEAGLRANAPPNVHFVGQVSDQELARLFQRSQALICAANEDLGLTALEAQACGTPVIAWQGGGYLETVDTAHGGSFFQAPTPEAIRDAILRHEAANADLSPMLLRETASVAFRPHFRERLRTIAEEVMGHA